MELLLGVEQGALLASLDVLLASDNGDALPAQPGDGVGSQRWPNFFLERSPYGVRPVEEWRRKAIIVASQTLSPPLTFAQQEFSHYPTFVVP